MSTVREPAPASTRPVAMTVEVTVTALLYPEEVGAFSIIIPAVPGYVSQAETIDEARANAKKAIDGWLASMHDKETRRGTLG